MPKLFGVDIARLVIGAFDGNMMAATVHKATTTIGAHGEPTISFANHTAQGVRTAWDSKTAAARGYPNDAVKIILLQDGECPAIAAADEITIMGSRWRVLDRSQDPVSATWTVAGVPA